MTTTELIADVHLILTARLPGHGIEITDATKAEAWNPMDGPEPAWFRNTFVLGVRIDDWRYSQRFTNELLHDASENLALYLTTLIEQKRAAP